MGSKMILGAILSLMCMASLVTQIQGHPQFDVRKFGAKADGLCDDSQAFLSAWKGACNSPEPSIVVIPNGTYAIGSVEFRGPCKAHIEIQGQGTLKAPAEVTNLKSDSWVAFDTINGLTLSGGVTFDGQGAVAWKENDCSKTGKCNSLPNNLKFNMVKNAVIDGITSIDSKLFHINILSCDNVSLRHITIIAPESSIHTDGIHIGRSTMINISDATIKTGDDCVSLGDGSQHITVEKVTCGPGHGISVGSLGRYHDEQPVLGVMVKNCTFLNTLNGVRVKTWPASSSGIALNINFEDIFMVNVSTPILIDQKFCPNGQCQAGVSSRVKITGVSFKRITGTSATQMAVKLLCSKGIPCQDVVMSDIDLKFHGVFNASLATSLCANVKPILSGLQFPNLCEGLAANP